MENLIDILIILFILYALLGPVLRKRKPPISEPPVPESSSEETKSQPELEEQKILREIEELFGIKRDEDIEQGSSSVEDDEYKPVTVESKKSHESPSEVPIKKVTSSSTSELESKFSDEILKEYNYEGTIPSIEIDEFDYSKIDEYNLMDSETIAKKSEEYFNIKISEFEEIKRAIIYKEIFETPLALRMRRFQWQRNIH